MTHVTSTRWAATAVASFGLFATALAGQPPRPDPIDAARAQQRVADQKAEANVNEAIQSAERAAKGNNPAKAAQFLKSAQLDIDRAAAISGDARKQLTNLLQAKLAVVEGRPLANPTPAARPDPMGPEARAALKAAAEKYYAELKDVREGIKAVEKAQDDGRTREATAEIARLAKLYPTNPSVFALGQKESMQDRIANAQAHYAESSSRWVTNQKNLNTSSLPAIMDVEFPKGWKELSARRLAATAVQLTAKEKKIIEALDKPLTINFNERPLEEALQDLSNQLDVPLLLDKKSLEDLLIDLKKGVSLQAKGLSARTVLRSILGTQGLTFVVKDETIQVVTVERSKSLLTTRVYYLGDLVQGVGPFSGLEWGPLLNLQQNQANVAAIVDAVRKVDPLSWSGPDTGGPGTVTFHTASMSIIVRNSAEVHFSLGKSFGPGR